MYQLNKSTNIKTKKLILLMTIMNNKFKKNVKKNYQKKLN